MDYESLGMRIRRARKAAGMTQADLAEKLVELKVPLRNAHHRVGSFVRYCREHGKRLNEVTLEEMRETIREPTPEFLQLFDPEQSVAKRDITGATGFDQVAKQIEFWKKTLA